MKFTLGIDYGTNSVRVLVVRCEDGREFGSGVAGYAGGEQGVLLDRRDHNVARQRPGDYLSALERAVREALRQARRRRGFTAARVIGLGVASTGSSPIPVDRRNRALGAQRRWAGNLNAQCWLWKDHTAWREAARITELARRHRPHLLARCGNTYSSEWFWAKLWRCRRVAPAVFRAAYSWVELCDWVPAVLAGVTDPGQIKRGVCAAGHKALYAAEWGGLPDRKFLARLDPRLAALRDRLYDVAHDAATPAGRLAPVWARRLALPAGIPIAIGEFDVHYGAIGCGVAEGTLVKVIGTSSCDCGVVSARRPLPQIDGICGVVTGAILPGCHGFEAGQSAVGDIFNWFATGVLGDSQARLTSEAAKLAPGQSGLLALDWNNGNRTILVDQRLTGLLLGQTLQTTPAEIYRALIEATAFGTKAIIERLRESGVSIHRVVCAGGIAEKNPLLMQIYADVTGCTLRVAGSTQACALGAAVSAAVLAGAHRDFPAAQRRMTTLKPLIYRPTPAARRRYERLYALYRQLHDAFGGRNRASDLGRVMKDLLVIKEAVRAC
jgi:L-ribulokinase